MMKLEDLTLEELWELFPIELKVYNPLYQEWYEEEKKLLQVILPNAIISHIGSTAIFNIKSKPIIDILIECKDLTSAKNKLLLAGYLLMQETPSKISFNKGYLVTGYAERVFHIHIRSKGNHPELIFRDYLLKYPNLAYQYEHLKGELIKKYPKNRDLYTAGKSKFVNKILNLAENEIAKK